MTQTQHFVFGRTSAKTILDNTTKLQNNFCLPTNVLSEEAIKIALHRPIICYVKRTGKSRLIEHDEEMASMFNKAVHISPLGYLSLLQALPVNKLGKTQLNVIFVQDHVSKVQEHLFNMFFLKHYQKEGAKNGKVDYRKLEADFLTSLPKNNRIKDYLSSARRYSYAAYLSISSKTFLSGEEK